MGFDISQQHVGLNRVGVYLQTARTKGPGEQKAEGGKQKAEKRNEPWRRISGLVGRDANVNGRERKRKLARLVRCLQDRAGADFQKLETARENPHRRRSAPRSTRNIRA